MSCHTATKKKHYSCKHVQLEHNAKMIILYNIHTATKKDCSMIQKLQKRKNALL